MHAASAELEGDDTEVADVRLPRDGGVTWHLLARDRSTVKALATGLWIGGEPSPGGLSARLTQAKASVVGSVHHAVLVIVAAQADGSAGVDIQQTLLSFLAAQAALTSRVGEISTHVE
jgi:hypothetical protein